MHPLTSRLRLLTGRRLVLPGVNAPRAGAGGYPLPSPRHVSSHLHKDLGHHDHAVTMNLVAWGQVIDHDITFTGEMKPEEKGQFRGEEGRGEGGSDRALTPVAQQPADVGAGRDNLTDSRDGVSADGSTERRQLRDDS